jgi:hypothetical protein
MSKSHIKSRKITREMAQTDSLHEPLGNFTDSGTNKTKYFCLFVSTAILHDSAFLSLLDKINKEKVLFWFVE